MNRKVLAFASLLMILPIITTTFAYAAPWVEKKNDKFQTFYSAGKFNVLVAGASADRTYIPSFDDVEKMIIAWSENYITFQIKVGEEIYQLHTHFEVSGLSEHTYWKPVFADPAKSHPVAYRAVHTTAKYTFTFKPASGLDGSFTIQTIVNEGNHRTTSLSGTGDFKNVQIQAEVGRIMTGFPPFITITNEGLVIGWPE